MFYAETATETAAHVTFGEILVSATTLLLVVVTAVLIVVSQHLVKVTALAATAEMRKVAETATGDMADVATAATSDMADVANNAIAAADHDDADA